MSVHYSSDRNDWETPPDLFKRFDNEFHFTLDACATARSKKVSYYFSKKDNGLIQNWGGHRVWMNPPYGREITSWMRKAFFASLDGALVVCLVPARTDTAWWYDYAMKGEVRFIFGRIKFVGAAHSAPFPSALIIFRPRSPK